MIRSIQRWLSHSLIFTLVLLFLILWLGGSYAISKIVEDQIATRLHHDMESLLPSIQFDVSGMISVSEERLNPVFMTPFSGHYFILRSDVMDVRSRSLWDEEMSAPQQLALGETRHNHVAGPRDQLLLALSYGLRKQGYDFTLTVAEDLSPAWASIRRLQWRSGIIGVALLIGWILVQRWIIWRGLRPLDDVRKELVSMQHGEISAVSATVPLEVNPLVDEVNHLTSLLGQRLERYRASLGNLAHALKTPLTVLVRLCDKPSLDDAVRRAIENNTKQISRLIDRELQRARIAGGGIAGQKIFHANELLDLIATLKNIYQNKDIEINCNIPDDAIAPFDRDDMVELFGNLLDNAFKWARQRIECNIQLQSGMMIATIEDDGPGCPGDQLSQLSRRGIRIDEATAGTGLGLAIASDIVSLYDGELELGNSENLGGFCVSVALPIRSPANIA